MTAPKKFQESFFYFETVAQHGQLSLVSSFCNFLRKPLYWFSYFPGILSHSIPLRITRHLDLSYGILSLFIDGWPFCRRTTGCANRDEGRDMCPCPLCFRSNQRKKKKKMRHVQRFWSFEVRALVRKTTWSLYRAFRVCAHRQTHARKWPFSKVRADASPPSLDPTPWACIGHEACVRVRWGLWSTCALRVRMDGWMLTAIAFVTGGSLRHLAKVKKTRNRTMATANIARWT